MLLLLLGFAAASYVHLTSTMSEQFDVTAKDRLAAAGLSVVITIALVLLLRFGPPFVQFTFDGSGDDVQRVSYSEIRN